MPLKITFKLGERDVRYLRGVTKKAQAAAAGLSEDAIIAAASAMVEQVRAAKPPAYVLSRIDTLETLCDMMTDRGWAIPAKSRRRALGLLSYFSDPEDLIPDSLPGLGFLDDAIIIELGTVELKHELKGFVDFSEFRRGLEYKPPRNLDRNALDRQIANKRRQLRARIQERVSADEEKADARPLRLFR
jgi:hypothetical protein